MPVASYPPPRRHGLLSSYATLIGAAALVAVVGCAAAPSDSGQGTVAADQTLGPGSKRDTGGAPSGGNGSTAANAGSKDDRAPAPTSKLACSPAGIAAYADALAKATRTSCKSDGTGVVNNENYECSKAAIDSVAPPHPDKSYEIVTTLLAPNQEYPKLECTYFIQMVTAGVCGTPVSPSDTAWTDYPLAYTFIDKAPDGWTWFPNDGTTDVQVGDIFVRDSSDGGQDPGHIMIVAEVLGDDGFRIAEANELNPDGSPASDETGDVSNTRILTLDDPQEAPAGWLRLDAR